MGLVSTSVSIWRHEKRSKLLMVAITLTENWISIMNYEDTIDERIFVLKNFWEVRLVLLKYGMDIIKKSLKFPKKLIANIQVARTRSPPLPQFQVFFYFEVYHRMYFSNTTSFNNTTMNIRKERLSEIDWYIYLR